MQETGLRSCCHVDETGYMARRQRSNKLGWTCLLTDFSNWEFIPPYFNALEIHLNETTVFEGEEGNFFSKHSFVDSIVHNVAPFLPKPQSSKMSWAGLFCKEISPIWNLSLRWYMLLKYIYKKEQFVNVKRWSFVL